MRIHTLVILSLGWGLVAAGCGGDDSGSESSADADDSTSGTSGDEATSDASSGDMSDDGTTMGDATDGADTSDDAETSDTGDTGDTDDTGETGGQGDFVEYDTLTSSYVDGDVPGAFGQARDVAFDLEGNIVVVGGTAAGTYPTTPGAHDETFGGPGTPNLGSFGTMDVFVSKFTPDGQLLWSTFLGGPSYDRAYAVEVAPNGDVVVGGRAGTDFPTTSGVVQETFGGDSDVNSGYGPQDGFVVRLSADGGQLEWSTYFGATGRGFVRDLDVDDQGEIHVALSDVGGSFAFNPTVAGPRSTPAGNRDAYYGRLSADGETLEFGTYLGGTNGGNEDGINPSVRVGPNGGAYIVTFTRATDVDCITNGAYQSTNAGEADFLVAHFDASDALVYCTYYGGSGFEGMETHSLAVDDEGNAYITGGTNSANLPTTAGVAYPDLVHASDAVVAKFSPDGTQLLAATHVGMPAQAGSLMGMSFEGLAVTPNGDLVAGGSDRPNDTSIRHALVARISEDLTEVHWMETYGGSGRDELRGLDVAPNGDVAYSGQTTSVDWPIVSAYDDTYDSAPDAVPAYVILRPQFE